MTNINIMKNGLNLLSIIVFCSCTLTLRNVYAEALLFRQSTQKPFADVVQDVEYAIEAQNFRITARNDIGRAIRERGTTDFPATLIIHFCNLQYAETLLTINPDLLLAMPCRIAIYQDKQTVIISTPQLPPSTQAKLQLVVDEINHILQAIVRAGAE
ncbi:DUF302 domain-containing protein [Beggiatoa leptomitoformis]|uniref:DUF302 domain-containing protein n=1 Tax=Beggiatoa leptomitoformis TaxID=288004 RepID=A0A2N9YGX2_9GAMM|nr:DUF302 domain-containing protein [Beggiatoa leptomitoformis]ALG69445.2 DUF302 domain-containing protein [Beggiatoa leptomitoformis]AUI69635.1 DUF302 domain-containing protein [Beggiatoa leptomitoformis]